MGKYDDIIDLPPWEPKNRHRMPNYKRAAQFAPFAALSGYEEVIKEVERRTQKRVVLDESEMEVIDRKLRYIRDRKEDLLVEIRYFLPDKTKEGGSYETVFGHVIKIDPYRKQVMMESGEEIPIEEIAGIVIEPGSTGRHGDLL